jgi:hypothetical protein
MNNYVENVLYIEASNDKGSSWVTLGLKEGNNTRSLFNNNPLYLNVPQVYVSVEGNKNAVQFLTGETTHEIPLGVRCDASGKITLRFKNLDHFHAGESLVLVDKSSGATYDLLMGASVLQFSTIPDMPDRFLLRMGQQTSGISENASNGEISVHVERKRLNVEASEKLSKITVTNLQGVRVLDVPVVNSRNFSTELNVPSGIYIVNVTLLNGKGNIEKIVVRP